MYRDTRAYILDFTSMLATIYRVRTFPILAPLSSFGRSKGIRPFILTCSFCLKTHTKRQGLPAPCRRQKNRPEGRICTKRGKNIETHYLHEALASKKGSIITT